MEITEVKVFKVGEDKLKAFVSIVLDQCFMVNDIKVIQGKDGLFISMPSRRKRNGEFRDVAHPLNNPTRKMIEDRILEEYQYVVEGSSEPLRRPKGEPAAAKTDRDEGKEPDPEKSLDEIEEFHLRDSFWSLP